MNTTILNWNDTDHVAIYQKQLKEQPLYYDPNLKIWVAYSYAYCKALLLNTDVQVPVPAIGDDSPLNDKAKLLLRNMARVSNDAQHVASHEAAMLIYRRFSQAPVSEVLETLLDETDIREFDWVEVVCKQLPIRLILKRLGFNEADSSYISINLAALLRIMLPNKTADDIKMITQVTDGYYEIAEKYVDSLALPVDEKTKELIVCNLIGLFIQCYDAGRGLLCNTFLNLLRHNNKMRAGKVDDSFYKELVDETLRHDPPVHNTRRLAVVDISLGGQTIKAGETVMIVLAAANLDPEVFNNPRQFDIMRDNNDKHLTFGLGGHNCLAKYFSIDMAAEACRYIADKYPSTRLLQNEFTYEPQLNVRLVKELVVSLC